MTKDIRDIERNTWLTIATRDASKDGAGWKAAPGAVMGVQDAKQHYDNGLLEMAQRRLGDTLSLVIMVRRRQDKERSSWFFRPESEWDSKVAEKRKEMARIRINYPTEQRERRKSVQQEGNA